VKQYNDNKKKKHTSGPRHVVWTCLGPCHPVAAVVRRGGDVAACQWLRHRGVVVAWAVRHLGPRRRPAVVAGCCCTQGVSSERVS
jgi:hypothetical protein